MTYLEAAEDTDVVVESHVDGFEETRYLRSSRANVAMHWQLAAAPDIAALEERAGGVDVIAPDGHVTLRMRPMFAIDASGVRIDVPVHVRRAGSEWEISTDRLPESVVYPVAVDPVWTTIAPMSVGRIDAASVTLADGRVLVVGGQDALGTALSSTEAFDPTSGAWSARAALPSPLSATNAVRLGDGRVLVVGSARSVALLYDPVRDVWSTTATPASTNGLSPLLSLADGSALGIDNVVSTTGAAERYDPTTNRWTTIALASPHGGGVAVEVSRGKVLVVSGGASFGAMTADMINVAAYTSSPTAGAPSADHSVGAAFVRADGTALVAGGPLAPSSEVFDPRTGIFSSGPAMSSRHSGTSPLALTSGAILLAGGDIGAAPTSSVDLYDPGTSSFVAGGSLSAPRFNHVGASLGNRAIVAGGNRSGSPPAALSSVELFALLPAAATCATGPTCTTGHCVDGVCCDSACTGNCQACDVAGSVGTCSPVSGATHGARSCAGNYAAATACIAGACRTSCATDGECATGYFCNAGACTAALADVSPCSRDAQCISGHCIAGSCGIPCSSSLPCSSGNYCDGTRCQPQKANGQSCTDPAQCVSGYCPAGTCTDRATNGTACKADGDCQSGHCIDHFCCGDSRSCSPYICGATACKTACASDNDCVAGFSCQGAACAPKSAKCSDDRSASIDSSGVSHTCNPVLCDRGSGICGSVCRVDVDCVAGLTCNPAGQCVAAAGGSKSGGCSVGSMASAPSGMAAAPLLGMAAWLLRARRRSRSGWLARS